MEPLSEREPSLSMYRATLEWLLLLEARRGMEFKLERVARALAKLDDPQRAFRSLHVAGTNGKGSVAAMSESILRHAGVRTGLYTSPHLVDFRERIRVADAWISMAAVVELVAEIRVRVDVEGQGLTFFEVATILAFLHFARSKVEVAVVEVGLGGRLDATNVLDADVAVITSIGFDHEAFLGNSLAEIAREKAGILKANRPAVLGPLPPAVLTVIEGVAERVGAPLVRCHREFTIAAGDRDGLTYDAGARHIDGLRPALLGEHQIGNAAVAIAAVDLLMAETPVAEDSIRSGIASVRWPGRLDVVSREPLVILDAAHNMDGARVLAEALPALLAGRSVHLVFGVLADKRWPEMVQVLSAVAAKVTVTGVPVPRGAALEPVAQAFAQRVPTTVCADPLVAVQAAIAAASPSEAVVVAGSVFLIGAVYPLFAEATARPSGGDG